MTCDNQLTRYTRFQALVRRVLEVLAICLLLGFSVVYVFWSPITAAQVTGVEYQWKKTVDKDGIQVFSSKVPGSKFRAVRAQSVVKGSVNSLVAMLEDTENCSNWASLCREVSLIKEVSEKEYFIYILNAVTFPASDRDLVAHIRWSQDPDTGKVSMNSEAVTFIEGVPKRPGVVRLKQALTQWHFTPLEEGQVQVESYAHIDPNGVIPAWIINSLSKRAPYRSMKKVRGIIESGQYENIATRFKLAP